MFSLWKLAISTARNRNTRANDTSTNPYSRIKTATSKELWPVLSTLLSTASAICLWPRPTLNTPDRKRTLACPTAAPTPSSRTTSSRHSRFAPVLPRDGTAVSPTTFRISSARCHAAYIHFIFHAQFNHKSLINKNRWNSSMKTCFRIDSVVKYFFVKNTDGPAAQLHQRPQWCFRYRVHMPELHPPRRTIFIFIDHCFQFLRTIFTFRFVLTSFFMSFSCFVGAPAQEWRFDQLPRHQGHQRPRNYSDEGTQN